MTADRDDNALSRLADGVIARWPSHSKFLERSLGDRSPEVTTATLDAAVLIERLVGDEIDRFVAGYRWVCEMVIAEEIVFRRTGNYRYSSFADANREVYQNAELMARYMDGVLLSQIFWSNHAAMLNFYRSRFLCNNRPDYRHLEIGPGHGLLLYYAAIDPRCGHAEGWDVSPTSLEHTSECLRRLGIDRPVSLARHDIMQANRAASFDSITISEVLEHVENPGRILGELRALLAPAGRIYINVPVNSPAIDHIFLWRQPEDAVDLVWHAGLEVTDTCLAPASGYSEEKARHIDATISCGIVARRPAD